MSDNTEQGLACGNKKCDHWADQRIKLNCFLYHGLASKVKHCPDRDLFTVYVWPDGTWIYEDDYHDQEHAFMGDDFEIKHLTAIEMEHLENE